ncbi:bifunctional metallophosphatase/5'-nucleotidase [Heyndrickxia sp. NPDC080065]|uniref:bifunctional metallophosphatase/5'-nucleotidase n=1 Tax=Heyndrickxia sp. NPDC080065 TaxID=3390568 RepID=UPI003D081365
MFENIHIFHTNDVHSHFENWPRIREFLLSKKKEHEENGEEVFLFDIGDHVDRWHPFTEATIGKGNIHLLNEVGYTAVTIGNNEGITLPYDDLDSLYTDADFDVIIANLYKKDGSRPNWALPYRMYQTKSGVKIGVTAVTANFKKLYGILGWDLVEPFKELSNQIKQLKNESDILILLSHLGIHDDEKIAKLYPEIDIILGGHTHHILQQGKHIDHGGTTLLGAAGKHGNFVGYIRLKVSSDNHDVIDKQAKLYETRNLPSPLNEKNEIASFYDEGKKMLYQEVVNLPVKLSTEWFKASPLPQILCEAIEEWCDADCAFINAGLVLDDLEKGIVTKYDLHKILPHPINPCIVELNGAELQKVIFQTFDSKWPSFELKGLGFRGTILGNFVYHNITFHSIEQRLYINGSPLEEEEIYRLGTVDMYTFGHFFPEFLTAKKQYFMPEFLRDVMAWKFRKEYGK